MATTTRPAVPTAQAHGHAHHGPELRHHFETARQQKEAATLGMWAFLVTEVMLFGGIFMAYILYRWAFPDVWAESAHHLNTPLGTVNTVVLLVSSLTVALAVHAAESGNRRTLLTMLGITLLLGFAFLGIKAYEYSEKFSHCNGYSTPLNWVTGTDQHAVDECLVPGRAFIFPVEHGAEGAPAGAAAEGVAHGEAAAVQPGLKSPYQLFYFLYFVATGLHAVHMIIGITIVSILAFLSWRGLFTPSYFTPVEIGGLYWHLIDIVWVFLFPLFYLVH
ncbi:MAG: cytochrome c oxidase subunit 3 [Chloroflexi bacterium OHK40]